VKPFLVFVALLAATHCGAANPPAPPAHVASAPAEESFELHPGEKVAAAGGELDVTFLSVLEDSRCPKGEQCIQAGRARLSFEAVPRGGDAVRFELVTSTDDSEAVVGHYRIVFRGLEPYPSVKAPIGSRDYVARILIIRL
jgi:hypothetical protein